MNASNALLLFLVLVSVWMVNGRQIPGGTTGKYEEIDKEKDVSPNVKENEEANSFESDQHHQDDSSSYSEYEHSHEMKANKQRMNSDTIKSRQRETLKNCGAQVNGECCPERENDGETAETSPGATAESTCLCRCSVAVVNNVGAAHTEGEKYCPKGQGTWPGLSGASRRKHHKRKYKKP